MNHCLRRPLVAAMLALLAVLTPLASHAGPASPSPDLPDRYMSVDEVRIGMKGYGLTVFAGTKIEPFPVEVVSIVANEGPQHAAIWIRSDDPRLLKSGPVQGMSGSPIYLWDEGEAQTLGEGGRMIGAFAFGFSLVKDALAGVQPIEYMLGVGSRTGGEPIIAGAGPAAKAGRETLGRMQQMARQFRLSESERLRLDAVERMLGGFGASDSQAAAGNELGDTGQGPQPLMLPMAVGSREMADIFGPLLEPMGLRAVAGSAMAGGAPPAGMETQDVRLQPGSVLAIPLALGDLDMSAAGTVTDVLPDGTVLGFGHAMMGQGDTALPMANGYVHFVVPRISTSFKMAGSLEVEGSILQDEYAAVAGTRGRTAFSTAPVNVSVRMPDLEEHDYSYQVVDHPLMTPSVASNVMLRSVTAVHNLPMENTVYLRGEMRFSGGRTIDIDSMIAGGEARGLVMELMPPLVAMSQNPFERLKLEGVDIEAEVVPDLLQGSIVNARVDAMEVAPGEQVGVTVWVQPYESAVERHRLTLEVPEDLAEGDYQLSIHDAAGEFERMVSARPHLLTAIDSVDELADVLQRVMSIRKDAIYLSLQVPGRGIAVAGSEMAELPSSRRAMVLTPGSSVAAPFFERVTSSKQTELAVEGTQAFTIHVREPRG